MHIPTHLQHLQEQVPDFEGVSNAYTRSILPKTIPWKELPGARLLKSLRENVEFELLQHRAGVSFDSEDDDAWLPEHYLGGGGYGQVGVYRKRDMHGYVADEIALKDLTGSKAKDEFWYDSIPLGLRRRLMKEAVIQRQLNKGLSENLVHLRDYKYYHNGLQEDRLQDQDTLRTLQKGDERWRFYQELAPYRDLYSLLDMYRYWNTYLPEAFLWHVFDSLAEAAVRMRKTSWGGMPTTRIPPGKKFKSDKIVNFDIKSENIFLGYPEHRKQYGQEKGSTSGGTSKYNYPVIKIGDFGLCEWTGREDLHNPGELSRGTPGYIPPEQTMYGGWWEPTEDSNWTVTFDEANPSMNKCAFQRDQGLVGCPVEVARLMRLKHTSHFVIDDKTHVWAIGKVIYDLMTLSEEYDLWKHATDDRDEFITNGTDGYHMINNCWTLPFYNHSKTDESPYSSELVDLVEECLAPLYKRRMRVQVLKERTKKGMDLWDSKYTPGCEDLDLNDDNAPDRGVQHPKLFYQENEINDMPRGTERHVVLERDGGNADQVWEGIDRYISMHIRVRSDPDWPELKPKWDDITRCGLPHRPHRIRTHHGHWLADPAFRKREFPLHWKVSSTGGLERVARDGDNGGGGGGGNDGDDNPDNGNDGDGDNDQVQPQSQQVPRPEGSPLSSERQPTISSNPEVGEIPKQRSPSAPPPGSWSSPFRAPTPDPDDSIIDPDNSDVEIAIRVLRNGRRVSYYRPRRGNQKAFDHKYVHHRRTQQVNENVAQWLGTGNSKFQDAILRTRERREEARRRRHEAQLREAARRDRRHSQPLPVGRTQLHQHLPKPRPFHGPGIHKPLSWDSKIRAHDAKLKIRKAQADIIVIDPPVQPPVHPPINPAVNPGPSISQAGLTNEYRSAFTRAQAGEIEAIPPGVNPSDRTFNYHSRMGAYMRQDHNNRLLGWQPPTADIPGRWLEVFIREDTERNRRLGIVGLPYLKGG